MDHRYHKFLAVCDYKSFSLAAKKLKVSQPAVTIAIASLERSLGVKLFVRSRSKLALSSQGEIVAVAARKIQKIQDKLSMDLRSDSNKKLFHVGLIDSLAYLVYSSPSDSKLLGSLEIMVDNSSRIINNILSNKIDAGLITGQPSGLTKDIKIRKLHNERFVFVRSPALTENNGLPAIDDWLAFNPESTSFVHFSKLFSKLGLKVKPIFYSTSMELLKDMAVNGKGTALLPLHLVSSELESGMLVAVKTKPLSRPIWAVIRDKDSERVLSPLSKMIDKLLVTSK